MSGPSRWERDAERVRKAAPAWADIERLPWWVFGLVGVAVVANSLYVLLHGGRHWWDLLGAVVLLVLLAPSLFVEARSRRRGHPDV